MNRYNHYKLLTIVYQPRKESVIKTSSSPPNRLSQRPIHPGGWPSLHRLWLILPLLICIDITAIALAHFVAYWVRMHGMVPPDVIPPHEIYLRWGTLMALVSPLIFALNGLYELRHHRPLYQDYSRLALAVSSVSLLEFTFAFFLRDLLPYAGFTFSRLVALWSWGLGIAFVITGRWAVRRLQRYLRMRGWGVHRTLVIGDQAYTEGYLARSDVFRQQGHALLAAAPLDWPTLPELIATHQADSLLVVEPGLQRQALYDLSVMARRSGLHIFLVPDIVQLVAAPVCLTELAGTPLLALQKTPLQYRTNQITKRALDLLIALTGLVMLSPLMGVIALAIRFTSPGPILYRQERISRQGEPFMMLKFRTMRTDSEVHTGPVWAAEQDPRITPIGRFLRRASLDELPQLLNVLSGQMSFVGPRPERPFFVEQFQAAVVNYPDRHYVKAGMIGWAQVNGLRGNTSIEERTRLDLYYIENWSLLFDLRIILRGFYTVIDDYFHRRAY